VFIQNTVVPAIRAIATQAGVPLIDNNSPLLNHPEYFSDGVHPNVQGAQIIATTNEVLRLLLARQHRIAKPRGAQCFRPTAALTTLDPGGNRSIFGA
jgi:hypothetical protein